MVDGTLRALVLDAVRGRLPDDDRLDVVWVTRNGARIDARVQLRDDEWWVVLDADDDHVDVTAIVERPRPHAGVAGGIVVVLNGPSSSGKSTVMRAIVDRSVDPWVAFDELFFGHLQLGYAIWPEVAPTLRTGFLAGIAALASSGNQVVMTSAGLSMDALHSAMSPATRVVTIGLQCSVDVLEARQRERTDRWGDLVQQSLGAHDRWTYDLTFDSAACSPEDIADAIVSACS